MACEAFPGEDGALVRTWLGGLLVRGLCLPEGLTVEQAAREREGARAAAEELAGEGAGLAAQVLAAQFVSAHAAAMDQQAEANRRDLPPHARATSQRLARQLMALTTSQVHALCRLEAAAEARAADTRALPASGAPAAYAAPPSSGSGCGAPRPALAAGFEQTLKDLARSERGAPDGGLEAGFEEGFAETAGFAGAADSAEPEAVGAGVPERPAEPRPPLNRRERRALARLRRKQGGR
jgi:hypothetical protein